MGPVDCFDRRMSHGPRSRTPTDQDLLEELRRLLATRGKLTSSLIEASEITRAPLKAQAVVDEFGVSHDQLCAALEDCGAPD